MSCPTVRRHRMAYPNRRPLLISAILVALTSIPTMIVVAAGTASLHQGDRAQPPTLAHPDPGPVIVGPGSASAPREHPHPAAASVQAFRPFSGRGGSGGDVGISSRTASRPEATAAGPVPADEPEPPPIEHDCPSPSASPDEPRMDDRAWPGWDRHLNTRPEQGSLSE